MQTWLQRQRHVNLDAISAVIFDDTPRKLLNRGAYDWSPDEVRFVRELLGPSEEQCRIAMEQSGASDDSAPSEMQSAWLAPLQRGVDPHSVLSVNFDIERGPGMSETWGWTIAPFSSEYHLLCEFGTLEDYPVIAELGYIPLGLADQRDPIRAASLILSNLAPHAAVGVFHRGKITCATRIRTDLRGLGLYRLMLAWDGCKNAPVMADHDLEDHWQGCCTVDDVRRLMGERIPFRIRSYSRDHPFYTDPNYAQFGPILWDSPPPRRERSRGRVCKKQTGPRGGIR